jgi:hypothetical protein
VASWIRTHVAQMKEVLDSCSKGACTHTPRAWDPLFAAVYRHAAKLDMKVGVVLLGGEGVVMCGHVPRPVPSPPWPDVHQPRAVSALHPRVRVHAVRRRSRTWRGPRAACSWRRAAGGR